MGRGGFIHIHVGGMCVTKSKTTPISLGDYYYVNFACFDLHVFV